MIWATLANIPVEQLLTFVIGGLLLNLAPGQDVFFASTCGIQGGPKAGAMAGLGVGLGGLCHVILVALGLGAVVAAHPGALVAIKYAGAGYLLYLAWKSWTAREVRADAPVMTRAWDRVRKGMIINLLNPKPALFLLAFLPQFTRPEYGPVWQQLLGLGLIYVVTGTFITSGYGVIAGYAGQMLGKRLGIMNKIAAVLFAGLAVRLVTK